MLHTQPVRAVLKITFDGQHVWKACQEGGEVCLCGRMGKKKAMIKTEDTLRRMGRDDMIPVRHCQQVLLDWHSLMTTGTRQLEKCAFSAGSGMGQCTRRLPAS